MDKCQAGEIIDVVKNHGYTLIKRDDWEIIENSQRKRAAEEAREKAMGELERTVQERTAELQASGEQLRALALYLLRVREEERSGIARELQRNRPSAHCYQPIPGEMARDTVDDLKAGIHQMLEMANELIGRVHDLSAGATACHA